MVHLDTGRLPGGLERAGTSKATSAPATGFTQGFANTLVTPGLATFYLAVVPSFLADSTTLSPRYLLYAILHVTMAFTYHTGWVWGLHSMRTFWARPATRRLLETLTGIALLALAWRLQRWQSVRRERAHREKRSSRGTQKNGLQILCEPPFLRSPRDPVVCVVSVPTVRTHSRSVLRIGIWDLEASHI